MLRPSSSYIPALDGMRGIAILLVFVAHIGFEKIVPGGLGVTLFFFISGYLITTLIISEIQNTGSLNFKLFFTRRLLRLYPPLLFMISLFYFYLFCTRQPINYHEVVAAVFYYENYYFYYNPEASSSICKILWSLAVEEHFYLVFPILFWLLYRYPKQLMMVMLVLLVVPLAFRLFGIASFGSSGDVTERYTYALTHTRFDSIMYGCLASILLHLYTTPLYTKAVNNKALFIFSVLMILACLVIRNATFRNSVRYSVQGLAFMVIVPAILYAPALKFLQNWLSLKVLTFIGKLSYSIYLTHMIAIEALSFIRENGQPVLFYLVVTLGTAALSLFSYYVIEKPFAKLRMRYRAKEQLELA
jgi:peptidoglycan/LPS O-acetylase OafA/YrhL